MRIRTVILAIVGATIVAGAADARPFFHHHHHHRHYHRHYHHR